MPAYDTTPQKGRVMVGAAEAAVILRKDRRTIYSMITSGELPGVRQAAGSRHHWFVYADALAAVAPRRARLPEDVQERDRLVEENARLHARAETAEEANRSLLAAQALLLDALRSYRAGSERIAAAAQSWEQVAQAWEQVAQHQREAIGDFQSSAGQFAEAFSSVRDILATQSTPDDARDLL